MDKETLSNYGWIVICVLVMVVMIALATPFGTFVSGAVQSTTQGLFDVNHNALESTGLINIDDQTFDVPDMNHGAGNGGNAGEVTGITYNMTQGNDVDITSASDITFRSDADFTKFVSVKVDGNDVAPENYTVVSGSTVVTLKADYVKTLANGTHTLDINSIDGKASCKFTVDIFDESKITYIAKGTDLATAISEAPEGQKLILQENATLAQMKIEKNIILDLNGNTLTTTNNYGGIILKNGATLKNGKVVHNGNTAAIKVFDGCGVEGVEITVTPGATDKVVTGIAVQAGANVNAIKNVTVNGASQGIEVGYQAHVGVIQNAKVNAPTNGTANGVALIINGGRVDSVIGCELNGDAYGVNVYLKGVYDVGVKLTNSKVSGATGIWAHDEVNVANAHCGTCTVTYDSATTINGGINWDFEDECAEIAKLNAPN